MKRLYTSPSHSYRACPSWESWCQPGRGGPGAQLAIMSYPFFQSFKKLNKKDPFEVCNCLFKFVHIKVTLLVIVSTLITTKQFVGEPITCYSGPGASDSERQLVSSYCLASRGIYSLWCVEFLITICT